MLCVRGAPISWRSEAQRTVTLSSTEAEWIAASEAMREVIFVLQLLESMMLHVELPVIVYVDNMGAIFMSNNNSTSTRTKHVDVRTKFVTQHVEDGTVKVVFVKSENNDADLFTKNLSSVLLNEHSRKMIMDSTRINK